MWKTSQWKSLVGDSRKLTGKKRKQVTKNNSGMFFHLQPFMTILTSSVKRRQEQKYETVFGLWRRTTPTTARGAKAPPPTSFHELWWEMLHLDVDPPRLAHPQERRVKEGGTARKSWGNHLYRQCRQGTGLVYDPGKLVREAMGWMLSSSWGADKGRRLKVLQSSQTAAGYSFRQQRRRRLAQEQLIPLLWLVEKKLVHSPKAGGDTQTYTVPMGLLYRSVRRAAPPTPTWDHRWHAVFRGQLHSTVATRLSLNGTSLSCVSTLSPCKHEGNPRHMQRDMLQPVAKTKGCRKERRSSRRLHESKLRGTARLSHNKLLYDSNFPLALPIWGAQLDFVSVTAA